MTATDRASAVSCEGTAGALTPGDVHLVARTYYTPERAADHLTGHPDARRHPLGHIDGQTMTYLTGPRGIEVDMHTRPPRAGHIPWRDLEAALTRHATPATVRALVAAADAYRRHLGAWHRAAADPQRTAPVPYDAETGARLERAARDALDALLTPTQTQGDLFDLESA